MQHIPGLERRSLPAFKQARNHHHYHYRGIIYKIGSMNTLKDQSRPETDCIEHLDRLLIRNQWSRENLYIRIKKVEALVASLEEMNREYEAILKFARNNPLMMLTGAELSELDIIQIKRRKYWEEWFRLPKKIEEMIVLPVRRIIKAMGKFSRIRRKNNTDTYAIFKSMGIDRESYPPEISEKIDSPLSPSLMAMENQARLEPKKEPLNVKMI